MFLTGGGFSSVWSYQVQAKPQAINLSMRVKNTSVSLCSVLGCHLGFGICGGLGRGIFAEGRSHPPTHLCTNPLPVKHPITIQNGGIENLVYLVIPLQNNAYTAGSTCVWLKALVIVSTACPNLRMLTKIYLCTGSKLCPRLLFTWMSYRQS